MKRLTRLALLAPLALAAACSSYNPLKWVGIISDPAHPPTPLAEIQATVTPRAAWTQNVGKGGDFWFRPALDAGRVYAAAADGGIAVIEEESGRLVRRIETKKPLSGGLVAADARVYGGTLKGEVVAVDPEGKVLWATNVGGEVIAPPEVSRNILVVRASDGRIFGLAAADGKRLWVYQRPTPSLLLRSPDGVLAIGGDVVAGYPNGKLIALDIDDGKLTWEVTVAIAHGATELERIADVAGLPVVDGPMVCAAAFQAKTACFEIQTRNQIWSKDVSTARSLATDAKNLYLVDESGAVVALDKKTGASVWKQDKLLYRRLTAPVAAGGHVVVGDGYGFLHVLSADTGALVGRLALDATAVRSLIPTLTGLLVQTSGGTVASIRF